MSEISEKAHIDILEEGTEVWNAWRSEHPEIRPQLAGEDLSDMDLTGANLGEADLSEAELFDVVLHSANLKMASFAGADLAGADLSEAELYKVDLSGAFLTGANLSHAYLAEADFRGADLRGAILHEANLTEANLSKAKMSEADVTGADFTRANITGANLSYAIVASVNLIGLEYGSFHSMRGNYHGIRGLDSCYGNALYVRDAQDQDYLDTLEHNIEQTPSPTVRRLKQLLFNGWARIDYGRSLGKPFLYAFFLAMGFGVIYFFDMNLGWGLMDYSGSAQSVITPFYYSIVTYTTLGFGDITPMHWLGEVIVVAEVILGYTTLGLLLSILANRVARQS